MRRKENTANQGGSVRSTDHPDLHRPCEVRALLKQAEQLVRDGDGDRSVDEGLLFRALNTCRCRLNGQKPSRRQRTKSALEPYHRLHRSLVAFLVQRNVGLVYDMLRRTRVSGVDRDELVSEGMWTLFKAVTSFDPWLGFRFSTYACTSILRAYISLGRKQRRDRQAIVALCERAEPRETGGESAVDIEVQVAKDQLARILVENTAHLTHLERFVIERRVLHDPGTKADTLAQVGQLVELSKERVRQIQRAALMKLEQALYDTQHRSAKHDHHETEAPVKSVRSASRVHAA